jgi:hypothetical protein
LTKLVSLLIICVAITTICGGVGATPAPSLRAKTWWNTLSGNDRRAFLAGENDCYRNDFQRPDYIKEPIEFFSDKVSQYYLNVTGSENEPILSVIQKLEPQTTEPYNPDAAHAENYPEKHGYFDGDYWYQIQESKPYFVEGYLACQEAYLAKKTHRTTRYYVEFMNSWYGYTDNNDVGIPSTHSTDEKIADVIAAAQAAP